MTQIIERDTARSVLPSFVTTYPAMLSPEDRYMYFDAGRHWRGDGEIVDLGIFLGGTTAALAYGAQMSDAISPRLVPTIFAYDRLVSEHAMQKILKWYYGADAPGLGESLLPIVRQNLAHLSGMVKILPGDILKVTWPADRPIEILGVDLCKSKTITTHVFREFFPALRRGSLVLHQDFIHPWLPHIHVAMGFFEAHFSVRHVAEHDATVAFELRDPIEASSLSGFSDLMADPCDAWLGYFDRIMARIPEPQRRSMKPARVLMLGWIEGAEAAQAYARQTPSQSRQIDEQVSKVLSHLGA